MEVFLFLNNAIHIQYLILVILSTNGFLVSLWKFSTFNVCGLCSWALEKLDFSIYQGQNDYTKPERMGSISVPSTQTHIVYLP